MFQRITFLIALLSFLTGCSETAHAQRDYAHMLQKQGKYKQALAFYSEAIRLDPKDPESYIGRADIYNHLDEGQKALEDCDKAIALGERNMPVYRTRATALIGLGKTASAMDDLNKAVALTPGNADVLLIRALLAEKIGLDAVGVEDASKALTLDPLLRERYSKEMLKFIAERKKDHHDQRVLDLTRHLDEVLHRDKFGTIDYGPYMSRLRSKIEQHWHPPKQTETNEAKVRFSVRRDGKLDGVQIAKTSGSDEVDAAALQAVRDTAPFDALPAGAPEKVEVEFSFDYNVWRSGRKSPAAED